jgi:hypothetical protein
MKRLQGSNWHDVKEDIIIESYSVSKNGNIVVFGHDDVTNRKVFHWLNAEEKEEFDTTEYEEKAWEEQFKEEEK